MINSKFLSALVLIVVAGVFLSLSFVRSTWPFEPKVEKQIANSEMPTIEAIHSGNASASTESVSDAGNGRAQVVPVSPEHAWPNEYVASVANAVNATVSNLPELVRRARANDLSAMRQIMDLKVQCAGAPKDADDIAYRMARLRNTVMDTPELGPHLAGHSLACKPYREAVSEQLEREILFLAAEAGDAGARSGYVMNWPEGIAKDGAYPDELALYRANSRRYLDEMFAQGDIKAIGLYVRVYDDGWVYDRDVALRAAYSQFYAELDHGPNGNIMRMSLTKLDPLLDDAARERQRAMVERLRREFVCRTCAPPSSPQPPKG